MKRITLFCLVALLACAPLVQAAPPDPHGQSAQPGAPIAEKKDKDVRNVIPVSVLSEGTDSLGARLVMRLKERLNQSSFFRLERDAESDAPVLMLMVLTEAEFSERPSIGSVYSICWVFKQGKGYLPFMLKHAAGIVSSERLEGLVDRLVERTDGIASRYVHLFRK